MEYGSWALLALAAFAGATVQAATGFGFALVAAPLFLIAMSSTSAMQVLVALHIVQSAMVVPRLVTMAPRKPLLALGAGSLLGFPVGLAIFLALDIDALKLAVGVMILVFTALLLARDGGWLGARIGAVRLTLDAAPVACAATGFLSGALTAVLVMPGPPLILLLVAAATGKDAARALSLSFFGFCYVMVTALHVLFGSMGETEWRRVLVLAPAVVAGTLVGAAIARRLSERAFKSAVYAVLAISGSLAVWSSAATVLSR